jgi:hypothetical protein
MWRAFVSGTKHKATLLLDVLDTRTRYSHPPRTASRSVSSATLSHFGGSVIVGAPFGGRAFGAYS